MFPASQAKVLFSLLSSELIRSNMVRLWNVLDKLNKFILFIVVCVLFVVIYFVSTQIGNPEETINTNLRITFENLRQNPTIFGYLGLGVVILSLINFSSKEFNGSTRYYIGVPLLILGCGLCALALGFRGLFSALVFFSIFVFVALVFIRRGRMYIEKTVETSYTTTKNDIDSYKGWASEEKESLLKYISSLKGDAREMLDKTIDTAQNISLDGMNLLERSMKDASELVTQTREDLLTELEKTKDQARSAYEKVRSDLEKTKGEAQSAYEKVRSDVRSDVREIVGETSFDFTKGIMIAGSGASSLVYTSDWDALKRAIPQSISEEKRLQIIQEIDDIKNKIKVEGPTPEGPGFLSSLWGGN